MTTRPGWYIVGGTRSDADVARMRKLLQETALINQWHEQRKASYSHPLLAYTATSLVLQREGKRPVLACQVRIDYPVTVECMLLPF